MARVRVICISDTHGQHAALRVPDGDILIHAGDFMTYGNAPREIIDCNTWLGRQPHAHKIVIAGNHDRLFESHPIPARALVTNATYLEDSGVEVEGLKFWGSPVQGTLLCSAICTYGSHNGCRTRWLGRKIEEASSELARIAKQDDGCHRLREVPGFGPIVSTALVAAIGNGISFRKGRDLAAWLGLVSRQHSTGGKTRLLGINKLGNEYLRRMMLHGARSVVMQMARKPSALGEWLTNLSARRHRNVTVVALASKMARIGWAILNKGTHYSAPALEAA